MQKIGWGVGAVAVVVTGAFALTVFGGGPRNPEPGGCANIERVSKGAHYRAVDCGSEHANLKVAKVVDDASECPTGGAPYTVFTRSATLCLIPNFIEGACYQGDRSAGMKKVDCTTAEAIRVVKVGPEVADCANGQTLTYPEPAITFCLARAADAR